MSPTSFKYSSLPRQPPKTSSPHSSSFHSSTLTRQLESYTLSSSRPSSSTSSTPPPPTSRYATQQLPSPPPTLPRTIPTTPSFHFQRHRRVTKYEHGKRDNTTVHVAPVLSSSPPAHLHETMAKRKDRRETTSLAPSSPPTATTDITIRPNTPTSPVQIPKASKRNHVHASRPQTHGRRRAKDVHTPNSISPSMAALLAVTDIPRSRRGSRRSRKPSPDKPLTVEDIFDERQVSEKELSWSLSRGTLDMLLTPPEHLVEDDMSISDSNVGSALSMRTISVDSIPSLGESFATDHISSVDTPSRSSSRRRSSGPVRKVMEPISSPPEQVEDHPLAFAGLDVDDFDSEFLGQPLEAVPERQPAAPFKPLRSVFKSNLTASLRALRSAAKSFSAISFATVPSEALLTRSLLTMDPKVPYTDERMPPVTDDMPSAEVRRYLNPSTSSHHEALPSSTPAPGSFSASIQMQTYKIQRSRSPSPTTHSSYPNAYLQSPPAGSDRSSQQPPAAPVHPGMRQREMRENPDFIRIAVMEMAMRKQGKLDDQRPGRARWALPPRKAVLKPYGVNRDGVPQRWVPLTV
ncbi:hypothetical protein LIA77_00102 [Sarocladium implicatum]|nr:hypothetical protein LIA77_00102 [Sarocladium implicatum]